MKKKNVLGKGLGAIFTDLSETTDDRPSYRLCGIEELRPNKYQPRKTFRKEELNGLVSSIREIGLIQPILVRPVDTGFEIIAGERRWRAAQAAGLSEVPVIVRSAEDIESAELSLIENIQREQLNPIEEATAYQTLIETFELSQEEVSRRVGKDRSTVTNSLRLLRLPEEVKNALISHDISSGHARSLLSVPNKEQQITALHHFINKGVSVREAELYVKKLQKQKPQKIRDKDSFIVELENTLSRALMTKIIIKQSSQGGTIEIRFSSSHDLDRLAEILMDRASASRDSR